MNDEPFTMLEKIKTLAERCFEDGRNQDELFNEIHRILGGQSIRECTQSGFIFPCTDCWTDDYDGSVEIIVTKWISRQEADMILGLGFSIVYESFGEEGKYWDSSSCGKASNRYERSELLKVKAERDALKAKLDEMRSEHQP